ncbi:hypothetical protein DKX38_011268 [Salix brachista]|uniref:DUF4283 domain-containing protein n=1 Tax=Salix brachista TaxID=2182728 RepID=A0A5N5LYU5_9ROSI|nr:hypothetical protein DKX38_011268 [Salix brachista]
MVLSNGFMVFRFSSTSAMEEVLARGPWMFGGKTVLLQKWTSGFQFDKNKIRAIPVWARLQGLPFPLWNKKGLSMAASMVGKPLANDEATLQGTRLEYARVCIEIEADLPLVHKFQVASSLSEDPITVDVTYEWKPSKCDICKVFGHACKVQSREEDLNRKRDEVGETKAVVHPHPPIPKQVQKSSVAKEKATGKGDHEGSDMGDAEERNAGLLTRSQKGKNIIEEDWEDDMIAEDQRDNVGLHTVNKLSSISSGMGAQEVDRGALNRRLPLVVKWKDEGRTMRLPGAVIPKTSLRTVRPLGAVTVTSHLKLKQSVRNWINFHNLDLFGLLETRISSINLTSVQANVLPSGWSAFSNIQDSSNCRILVGWNTLKFQVQCIHSSAQWLTCDINNLSGLHITRITFVYGFNDHVARSSLWHHLQTESLSNASTPWGIMGDFNSVLCPSDHSGGSSHWQSHHQHFPNCIMQSSLQQIPYTGLHLTWHNNQTGEGTIMKKLDWMFGNQAFFVKWPTIRARFLPREASDHSAMVMNLGTNQARNCGPFKFLNQW